MPNVKKPTLREDAAKAGPVYLAKWEELPLCAQCHRKMRRAAQKAGDWPATVSYGNGRVCATCKQHPGPVWEAAPSREPRPAAARASDPPRPKVDRPGRERFLPKTRQQIVAEWSPDRRSAALLVCEYVTDPKEAEDVLGSLGLFAEPASETYVSGLALERIGRTPDRGISKNERMLRDE